MNKLLACILTFALLFLLTIVGVMSGWFDTWFGNKVDYVNQKIDDRTNYETMKKVEDTCRASIASYETDKATWEQYKDSESELERSWASQAKMRANKTANIYNEYILKNSYIWDGNIPEDIKEELELLK